MERHRGFDTATGEDGSLRDETGPQDASIVDELFALPEAPESVSVERADSVIDGGLQAALARKMRRAIERQRESLDAA